ncbi:hypothetical protein CXQ85_005117 [Candidozyma haemuli]|uniref:RRM domain-containing protein n=1 Tax=Candidozyma haemuli TaxID=45357 RepID=A0A2V1AYH2_9ASCO|nr:hypothetical protein CXQ85_005117 [[Candida] haemuloni]PVH22546.1 hypothetical protein CXQ85_005117 [[Candida] haemuloni]
MAENGDIERDITDLSPVSGEGQNPTPGSEENPDLNDRSIYLGNLDYMISPQEIEDFCSTAGPIDKVSIIVDNSGIATGYAFVAFKDKSSVEKAVTELNQKTLKHRRTKVSIRHTKSENPENRGPRNTSGGRGRGSRVEEEALVAVAVAVEEEGVVVVGTMEKPKN